MWLALLGQGRDQGHTHARNVFVCVCAYRHVPVRGQKPARGVPAAVVPELS